MKQSISFGFTSLLVFALMGCGPKADVSNSSGSTLKSVSTDPKVAGHDATGSNNSAAGNDPAAVAANKPQEPGLDLAKIPADLKGDAYEYYGLGRAEPIKMTVNQNGTDEAATQTVKLTSVENGVATFKISNDGGLSRLGEVIVSLDKKGIKVVSVNGVKADADTFELPSGLSKGKTWPFKLTSGDLKLTGTNVVSGTESVTTTVGTYKDALLVVSTATGKQSGQKVQLKSKQWLVKGRGQVKAEITNVSGKTKQTVTMAESK